MRAWIVGVVIAMLLGCMGPLEAGDGAAQSAQSTDMDRLNQLAVIFQQDGHEKATPLLEGYVKDYPKDDLAWTILGHAYNDADQADKAKEAYEKALALNPKRFEATTGLGVWHRKRGEYDLAMAAYQQSVKADPSFAQAYSSMAVIAIKQLNDGQAVVYAEKAYALDATDPAIVSNLAIAYHYNGDVEKRDKMLKLAESMGYRKMDNLHKIVSGELTVRD